MIWKQSRLWHEEQDSVSKRREAGNERDKGKGKGKGDKDKGGGPPAPAPS